ncbi:Protein Mpv17 [Trichinella nativa]|uniref:Mitochondrial inner membrane protein Mpv17 n=2 Tax=Trichinella TaxID=6333 RepID=A0A0V1LSL8_9BILA|nr:Protein Mpv17 [Trichinella murrelli]KRZ62480.1 Protein Mpv17 [Trichinella nativa]
MIISGLLMGTGDVISQTVLEGHRSYNFFEFDRTFRFVFLGTFYTGPLIWAWFVKLDKIFVGHSLLSVIKRVALDQLLFSPVSYTGFILFLGFLQRLNFENIKEKWKTEFRQVYLTNLQLWPAVQLLNFYFIPIQHRLFVTKCVGIFWNTYLAWQTNQISRPRSFVMQSKIGKDYDY